MVKSAEGVAMTSTTAGAVDHPVDTTVERGTGVVRLLGPQRLAPTVAAELRELAPDGPVAAVTAGWGDRERDDAELDAMLDGRTINLELHHRQLDVAERDPELAVARRVLHGQLTEMGELYLVRLGHAISSVAHLQRLGGRGSDVADELEDAIEVIRRLDDRHLDRVMEARSRFEDRWATAERPDVARHRAEVAELLTSSAAVVIAGGRVDVLLDGLRRFDVAASLDDRPVVAWSAGAMALADRVVLFHDHAPQGDSATEVHDHGLGLYHGIVAFPHARTRLRLDDRDRMIRLARRFAPARCVLLDPGTRVADARRSDAPLTEVAWLDQDGVTVRHPGSLPGTSDQ
jgi:hypothetical protein